MSEGIKRLRRVAEKSVSAVCWQVWTNDVAELVKAYDEQAQTIRQQSEKYNELKRAHKEIEYRLQSLAK